MLELIATIAIAVAVGAVVGVIAGMLGVGGGTVLLPVFRLCFGLSAVATTATSLFTIIPTSASGAIAHIRNRTCVPKLGVAMGAGGALTSAVGVNLAQISPSWAIMLAAAVAIGYSAFTMLRKALAIPKNEGKPFEAGKFAADAGGESSAADTGLVAHDAVAASGANAASGVSAAADAVAASSAPAVPTAPPMTGKKLAIGVLIGAIAGVASGYIGLGGGFLMIPLMVSVMNMPMKLTSGTSLIAIMILALPATIAQCLLGNVDYLVGISIACGSIPGALVGSRLTKRLPERTLRLAFSGLLFFGAIMLVVKELGLLG